MTTPPTFQEVTWRRLAVSVPQGAGEPILFECVADFKAGTIRLTPSVEGKGEPELWSTEHWPALFNHLNYGGVATYTLLEEKYPDGTVIDFTCVDACTS